MFLSSSAPLVTMATSTYYPYPMHTAQASVPLRGRYDSISRSSYTPSEYNGPNTSTGLHSTKQPLTKPIIQPRPVQRVDSGIDSVSETSSVTITEEVERVRAIQLFLHQYHGVEDSSVDDAEEEAEEEEMVDEGNLGRNHRNSICMIAEKAKTWEDRAVRARRNRKSKLKLLKKWLKRKLVPGSDGRSHYMTL